MYMSNVSKNVHQTLMKRHVLLRVISLIEVSPKFMQEKTKKSYFRFMQFLQFELINDQRNAFSSQVFASIMFS